MKHKAWVQCMQTDSCTTTKSNTSATWPQSSTHQIDSHKNTNFDPSDWRHMTTKVHASSLCIWAPPLTIFFVLQRFEHCNVVKLHNCIMFDFYPGLPHMYSSQIQSHTAVGCHTRYLHILNLCPVIKQEGNLQRTLIRLLQQNRSQIITGICYLQAGSVLCERLQRVCHNRLLQTAVRSSWHVMHLFGDSCLQWSWQLPSVRAARSTYCHIIES